MSSRTQESLDDWMTTEAVAEHYDVPTRTVLRMIREDRLQAKKMGWQWVVHKDWLPEVWPPPVKQSA